MPVSVLRCLAQKKKKYLEGKLESYKNQLGEITLLLRRAGMVPKLRSG